MERKAEIALLRQDMLSFTWEIRSFASARLKEMGGEDVFQLLLSLLKLDNEYNLTRHSAADVLAEIGDDRAVNPLMEAILKNKHYNGSLVHSVGQLNCGEKFKELFYILFYHGQEAQMNAYFILDEQKFLFDDDDLVTIKTQWENIRLHPELHPNYRDKIKNMIDEVALRFLSYLKK